MVTAPVHGQACAPASGGGPVYFHEFTEARGTPAVGSITISTPCTDAGDLLITAIAMDGDLTGSLAPPSGEGWDLVDLSVYGASPTLGVWWKLAGATESPSHTFTFTDQDHTYAWMMRFTGHDRANPINAFSATGQDLSSTPMSPSITSTVDDALILRIGGFDDDDIVLDVPGVPGHTPITMDRSAVVSQSASGGAAYIVQAIAGPSGTSTFSLTASEESRAVTIAISPLRTPSMSSAADQTFWVGKAPTAIGTLTVADTGTAPSITATKDIRVRIPAGFDMSWDTLDVAATLGGGAAAKVSPTVRYEDAGATLVLDVTANFAAGDTITISDLSFMSFTGTSGSDNLELEVYNDDAVSASDDKTIEILAAGTPIISSEFDQSFRVGVPPITISTLMIVADSSRPIITATNDIRVRIPAGFNMSWDVSDTDAFILGTAASKVSSTVSYEDGGRTLVLDVTDDFAAGELITIRELSFANFTAASPSDNLELEVLNDGIVTAEDDKEIFIVFVLVTPHIASAENQVFGVGDPPTGMIILRITDDPNPVITAAGDIRITVPAGFNMIWDTTAVSPTISGRGNSNVSKTVSYEDGGRTMVIDVESNFSPNDWVNVKHVNFVNFTSASPTDRLRLDIDNDGAPDAVDDRTKLILGATYDVYVAPDTATYTRLPSNGTNYQIDFSVANIGSIADDYDLLASTTPGGTLAVISISGGGITQGANPDSARLVGLGSGLSNLATVTYSVANVPDGSTDTLTLVARSVAVPAIIDAGVFLLVVGRPAIATSKVVNPNGTVLPGTDLTYTITFTNNGSEAADSVVTVDSLAVEVDFKVGSVVNNLPGGIGVVVEYSNDGGAGWAYTPVSQGCGAPSDYDGCVTHLRWTLQNPLGSTAPDNTGTLEFIARIK
jgi:uncharacterized repeat protein (TIGR01451 family)